MRKSILVLLTLLFGSVFFMGQEARAEMVETSPGSYKYFENVDLAQVILGSSSSSAITTDGQLYMWGNNGQGQLGDGTNTTRYSPINITLNFDLEVGEKIVKVDHGDGFSLALTSFGRVFSWGDDYYRGIEVVPPESVYYPTDITASFTLDPEDKIIDIAAGYYHLAVWSSSGELFMWGNNASGQLGDGTLEERLTPVNITDNLEFDAGEKISEIGLGEDHSLMLTSMGRVFAWGSNYIGQLGDETLGAVSIPTKIDANFNFNIGESITDITVGKLYNIAMSSEGRVFTWGDNEYGQLGDGTDVGKPTPTDITSNFAFNEGEHLMQVDTGDGFFVASSNENRVFLWGYNDDGELGIGNNDHQYLPIDNTLAFELSLEEDVLNVSAGEYHGALLTSFGRCLVWGYNSDGELGDETTETRETPVEIQEKFNLINILEYSLMFDETIIDVSVGREHFAAVTSYGKLYIWGGNGYGQLGDGTTISDNIPIDLTGELNLELNEKVIDVELGNYFSMAITSNGRIFTWGQNSYGQLGNGNNADSLVPIELPQSSFDSEMITSIVAFEYSSAAYTSTGQLFTWGNNQQGQLGDGTKTSTNVPIEITSNFALNVDEKITKFSFGGYHAVAITSDGRLFTWGIDNTGQLGNGSTSSGEVLVPTPIDSTVFGGDTITDISTGFCHNEAVSSSGKLYTWGCNNLGQLGDGTTTIIYEPVEIPASSFGGELIVNVDAGPYQSFAITASGNTYGWGTNTNAQLGIGTRTDTPTPEIISSFEDSKDIITIAAGWYGTLAISSEGELFRWGKAPVGPIGNEGNIRDVVPVQEFLMNYFAHIDSPIVSEFYNDTVMVSVFPNHNIGDQLYSITINDIEYLSTDLTVTNGRIDLEINHTSMIDQVFDIEIDSIAFVEGVQILALGNTTSYVILQDMDVPTFDAIDTQTIEVGQTGFDWTVMMENVADNSDTAITLEVIEDNVVYDVLGTYRVTVSATDASLNTTSQTFDVDVVDTIVPVIIVTGEATIYIEVGDAYTELGATYTDNYDASGDAIVSGDTIDVDTVGTYNIEYNVTDTSGNVAVTMSRTVIVQDTVAPVVSGVADAEVYERGTEVTITFDDGTATLNGEVFTSGSVVSDAGDFTLVVTDAHGNTTTTVFTIEAGSKAVLIIIIFVAVIAVGAGGYLVARKYLSKV